jgi:hypothetical protein
VVWFGAGVDCLTAQYCSTDETTHEDRNQKDR